MLWLLPILPLSGALKAQETALPRAVSLDYCADQFVLKLADRRQIAGLSVEADNDYSYMRDAAKGLPQVRELAEDVLLRKPDVIIRHWGGGARAQAYYAKFGIRVVAIDFTTELDGIRRNILKIAYALGRNEQGRAVAADFDRRRAAISEKIRKLTGEERRAVVYMTPGGFTAGGGTLINDLITESGLRNAAAVRGVTGWAPLPLESLVVDPPQFIAAAFFKTLATRTDRWSAARHPVMRRILQNAETVYLSGSLVSCPAWFAIEASERLHEAAYGSLEGA